MVVKEGQTVKAAAAAFTVCPKTVRKWIERYRRAGAGGLRERSSRPAHSPKRIPPDRREAALAWRRAGLVYAEIAQRTGLSEATLSRLLRTAPRRPSPPPPPVVRYERAAPGELLHLDIKKLGRIAAVGHRITGDPRDHTRGAGWECVHVCIDDHSRVAYAEVRPDECKESAVAFLEAAVASYARFGVGIQRVLYHLPAFDVARWRHCAIRVELQATSPHCHSVAGQPVGISFRRAIRHFAIIVLERDDFTAEEFSDS